MIFLFLALGPFFSVELNGQSYFGRHHEEHFYENIFNVDQWFWRCHLSGPFVQFW